MRAIELALNQDVLSAQEYISALDDLNKLCLAEQALHELEHGCISMVQRVVIDGKTKFVAKSAITSRTADTPAQAIHMASEEYKTKMRSI